MKVLPELIVIFLQKTNNTIVKDAELLLPLQFTIEFLYILRYTQIMEMLESFPKFKNPDHPEYLQEEKQ